MKIENSINHNMVKIKKIVQFIIIYLLIYLRHKKEKEKKISKMCYYLMKVYLLN